MADHPPVHELLEPHYRPDEEFDFFVSYARADNAGGWITAFVEQLRVEHAKLFPDRELRPFFDTEDIKTGHDWQHRIAGAVGHSRLFIAFISPRYFASEWCRKEWRKWIETEIARHILTAGLRPIYVVEVEGLTGSPPMNEQQIAGAIAKLCKLADADRAKLLAETPALLGHMRRRQLSHNQPLFDVKSFYDGGREAIEKGQLSRVLEELAADLEEHRKLLARADASLGLVPAYNPKFTGRLDELLTLRETLCTDNRTGVISGIQGLGGIGKTELAYAYAHAFASAYTGGRFVIRCDGKTTLRDAVLGQGNFTALFADQIREQDRMIPDLHFAALIEQLRRRIDKLGHVLIVLDNVSDKSLLTREQTGPLTTLGPKLHLLATTRLTPPASAKDNWLVLGQLPPDDALALLERHRPFANDAERDAGKWIVKQLDGFTLAVELVAAYLAAHEKSTTYAGIAEGPVLKGLDTIADDPDVELARHNAERRLGAVLGPVLGSLSDAERRAMEYASLLPPDQIALPWLKELVTTDFPDLANPTPLGDPWKRVVERLTQLALLTRAEEEPTEPRVMRTHRLVQELVKASFKDREPDLASRQQAVNDLITRRDAELEKVVCWEPARWELEPFEAMAELWAEIAHPRAAWLSNQAALRLHDLAEYGRAEPLMRRALAVGEQRYGKDHPNVAAALNNLAQLLADTIRLSEAEPLMRRALAILEQSYGNDHPKVATALNNLASLLYTTNRLSEAEPLMRRALAIDERSHGRDHPSVAKDLNNLASLLYTTNRLSEAEPLMRRALEIDEQSYGKDHPNVARALNNLALLLLATNRLSEAEPLMRRALAINEQSYGKDHPNVATALSNLAQLLKATNRLSEAEPLMRRALAIDEQSYGKDHPEVATDLWNLASLLKATNRVSEAEPLMRRAVEIFLKFTQATGHQHPHLWDAIGNYTDLLRAMGRSAEEIQSELSAMLQRFGVSLKDDTSPEP